MIISSKKNKFFADDGWAFWVDGERKTIDGTYVCKFLKVEKALDGTACQWKGYIKGHDDGCKYGRMRKDHLKNHRHAFWNRLPMKNTLYSHLLEVDSEVQTRFNALLSLYCERYSVAEELKANNQIEWVRRMNNIINAIEEIILKEIIYR